MDRRTSTYDSENNITSVLSETWIAGEWTIKNLNNLYFYNPQGKFAYYFVGYKMEINYKSITPVKDEINNAELFLNCSPNPAMGPMTINYTITEPNITSVTISNLGGVLKQLSLTIICLVYLGLTLCLMIHLRLHLEFTI